MHRDPFDDVAPSYDNQRAFPAEVGIDLRDAVLGRVPAGDLARFLEIGIGTGRVAEPFLRAGCRYCGIDASAGMLARCRAKLDGEDLALVRGDMRHLPFPDRIFDVVVAASVFRVVQPWQAAVAEAERVLTRPGLVVLIRHVMEAGGLDDVLGREKRAFLQRCGVGAILRGGAEDADVARFFADNGAAIETFETTPWRTMLTPRAAITRHLTGNRVVGQPWAGELADALAARAVDRYGSLDAAQPVARRLRVIILRLPETCAERHQFAASAG